MGFLIRRDHANGTYFCGLPLQALLDDQGFLRRVLLYRAHAHVVVVAVRLLHGLRYRVVTGDKGYRMVNRPVRALSRQGIVPYCKTQGLVFHLCAVMLGYGPLKLIRHNPA